MNFVASANESVTYMRWANLPLTKLALWFKDATPTCPLNF
jgi:hypothetical protein